MSGTYRHKHVICFSLEGQRLEFWLSHNETNASKKMQEFHRALCEQRQQLGLTWHEVSMISGNMNASVSSV